VNRSYSVQENVFRGARCALAGNFLSVACPQGRTAHLREEFFFLKSMEKQPAVSQKKAIRSLVVIKI
jgi:hypothetical protein